MTEEPTDADGAPTATARRDATHNAKSTRHLAHSHAGKMALDWCLLAWRCVIARWWLLQAVLSRREVTQLSAARAAAGSGPAQPRAVTGVDGSRAEIYIPARPQITRLKCRHFSARQTSDRTTDVTGPCKQEERPCRLQLPPQAPELVPVTRTVPPRATFSIDAVAGVRPSYTFLLLLRSCTCARRDVGAETLVSGSAASRPPAHSASVRC